MSSMTTTGPENNCAGEDTLPNVKAPALVAFNQAVDIRQSVYARKDGDPFQRNECPPWCLYTRDLMPGEHAHPPTTTAADRQHVSASVVIPVHTIPGAVRTDGRVEVGSLAVNLQASTASTSGVWPTVALDRCSKSDSGAGRITRYRVALLHPVEAVELARALLVSARLADPRLDTEGVTW